MSNKVDNSNDNSTEEVISTTSEIPIQQQQQQENTSEGNEIEETSPKVEQETFKFLSVDDFEDHKALKTEEEFYKAAFQTFKNINDYMKPFKGRVLTDIVYHDILPMVVDYSDNINSYLQYADENRRQQLQDSSYVWDLATILFFSPEKEKKQTIEALRSWLNEFDPIELKDNELDWNSLHRNVVRGNIDEAIELLSSFQLEEEENAVAEQLSELLNAYKGITNDEKFDCWRSTCQNQLTNIENVRDSAFQHKSHFRSVYLLLAGDPESIKKTGTFFDQLMGAVHYAMLYASRREIFSVAGYLDTSNLKGQTAFICAALLLDRVDEALQYCRNYWMETHLGHLFLTLGIIEEPKAQQKSSVNVEVGVDPIYYSVDAYAHEIADKYNMWNEAVTYISICVPNRVIWVERLLESPKAKNIPLLQSVLETVDECSIYQAKSYIHKTIGQLYEKENDIYKATIEYGEAQDISSLDRIGTDLFNKCVETGKLQDNVSEHEELRISPIYDCIMKYNELRNHLEKKQYNEASRIVLDILTSNNLPDEFKSMIFIDADAILSVKHGYYNQEELINLLDIFQTITSSSGPSYFEQYYQQALGRSISTDVIIVMLREKMAYRAAIAT